MNDSSFRPLRDQDCQNNVICASKSEDKQITEYAFVTRSAREFKSFFIPSITKISLECIF